MIYGLNLFGFAGASSIVHLVARYIGPLFH
jgi:hypothetical protein